ncbi:MAG TPA: winged helix-turn-helix domain-containing protein [Pyrinomonadaceae bacterium]|nr:winged helix-turn-helix domain-containing protein [Pyrinomonadaceae bacterium]
MDKPSGQKIYEFDDFLIDVDHRMLYRHGLEVSLAPKAVETLLALIDRRGQIVSKDEILDAVWPDTAVEESNLFLYLSILRKTLGKRPDGREYLETFRRRGYRFNGDVRPVRRDPNKRSYARIVNNLEDGRTNIQTQSGQIYILKDWLEDTPKKSETATVSPLSAVEPVKSFSEAPPTIPEPDVETDRESKLLTRELSIRSVYSKPVVILFSAAVVVAIAVLGWAAMFIFRGTATGDTLGGGWTSSFSTDQRDTEISLKSAKFRRLTTSGTVYEGRISPDGKFVAYSQLDKGAKSLWLRQIVAPDAVKVLSGTEWIEGITFSPDGNFLYYLTSTRETPEPTLYKKPVLGGEPQKLPFVTRSLFTFSPDGDRIAFYRHPSGAEQAPVLTISNIDGTEQRSVATVGDGTLSTDWESAYLAWSPDGKTILLSLPDRASNLNRIGAFDIDSGELNYLTSEEWEMTGHFDWTANSRSVVAAGRNRADRGPKLWQISYTGGEALELTNDVTLYKGVSLSNNAGALTTVINRFSANIWTVPISTPHKAMQLTQGTTFKSEPAFTPNDQIVFIDGAIILMDKNGENTKRLTDSGSYLSVCVSSTGFIVFDLYKKPLTSVYRMDLNGDNLKLLSDGTPEAAYPEVSPDGQWVYYLASQKSNKSLPEVLKKVSIEGGPSLPVLNGGQCADHAVSPDGNYIACNYSDSIDENSILAMIDIKSGKPTKRFKGVSSVSKIRWSPDGLEIFYIVDKDGITNIWAQPIDGSLPRQLTYFSSDRIQGFDVSPDGKQLVLSRGIRESDLLLISGF